MDTQSLDSITDGVIESLQIETPNGQTVARLTLAQLPTLDDDLAFFADGSAMRAVDDLFDQLKAQVQGNLGDTVREWTKQSVDGTFALMGQLSLIQQQHFGAGQLDERDDLFALAAQVASAFGLINCQSVVACSLYNLTVMDKKNRDYGSNNVSEYGTMGVLVRMRDKYHRAVRLQEASGASAVLDESLFDTWGDMANYSRIGQAITLDLWKNN